jgi:hypothetical protein
MPNTEHHRMDPGFEWRLKTALDRITPPPSAPRYTSISMGRVRPWRVAPVLLVGATAILLALTATATTGSPNPAVWTSDAGSTIGSVAHASPSPTPSPAPPPAAVRKAAPAPTHQPEHHTSPTAEPSGHYDDSPRPQPSPSPSPSEDHFGSSSPSPWPSPSPWSGDH